MDGVLISGGSVFENHFLVCHSKVSLSQIFTSLLLLPAKVAKSTPEVKDQNIALSKVNDHVKFVVSYSKGNRCLYTSSTQ